MQGGIDGSLLVHPRAAPRHRKVVYCSQNVVNLQSKLKVAIQMITLPLNLYAHVFGDWNWKFASISSPWGSSRVRHKNRSRFTPFYSIGRQAAHSKSHNKTHLIHFVMDWYLPALMDLLKTYMNWHEAACWKVPSTVIKMSWKIRLLMNQRRDENGSKWEHHVCARL